MIFKYRFYLSDWQNIESMITSRVAVKDSGEVLSYTFDKNIIDIIFLKSDFTVSSKCKVNIPHIESSHLFFLNAYV